MWAGWKEGATRHTWEERLAGEQLKHDAPRAPGVDLCAVPLRAQEQLGRPVRGTMSNAAIKGLPGKGLISVLPSTACVLPGCGPTNLLSATNSHLLLHPTTSPIPAKGRLPHLYHSVMTRLVMRESTCSVPSFLSSGLL